MIHIKRNMKKDVENGENKKSIITGLVPTAALNTKATEIEKKNLILMGQLKKPVMTPN